VVVGSLSPSSSSNSASPGKRCLNQPSCRKFDSLHFPTAFAHHITRTQLQICWPNVWLQPGPLPEASHWGLHIRQPWPLMMHRGHRKPPRVRGDYSFRHPLPVLFYRCLWEHGGKMAASRIWKLRHIFFNWWFNDLAHWSVGLAIVLLIEFKLSKRQLWHCGCWGEVINLMESMSRLASTALGTLEKVSASWDTMIAVDQSNAARLLSCFSVWGSLRIDILNSTQWPAPTKKRKIFDKCKPYCGWKKSCTSW